MAARRLQDEKMVKFPAKMASNGPHGPFPTIFRTIFPPPFPFGQKNEKIGSNKALQAIGDKSPQPER